MHHIKFLSLTLISTLLFGFLACNSNGKESQNEKQFATLDFSKLKDITSVNVKQLTKDMQYSDYHTLDLSNSKEVKLPLVTGKEADYYFFQFPTTMKMLILSPGEKVNLYYDSTYYNPQDPRRMLIMSSGSEESSRLEEVLKIIYKHQDDTNAEIINLQQTFGNDNQKIQEKMIDINAKLQEKATNKIISHIKQNMNSYANVYAVQMFDPTENEEIIRDVYELFKDKTTVSSVLKNTIDRLSINSIGTEAILFSLPDQEKKMINLKDLRGRHVLIDFWASWCRPCRDENPNIKKAYNKYKDKGFEVIGVSTDRGSRQWNKAIKDDGLNWLQVLDSTGMVASAKYKVDYIPQSLLLDPDGKIIGKNLRGQQLHKKLKEIFGI